VIALCGCGGSSAPATHPSGKVHGHTVKDLYGSLPKAGAPTGHGTITMGQLNGDTPTYLFPIVPGANATDGTDGHRRRRAVRHRAAQGGGQAERGQLGPVLQGPHSR
jgi:hypothetical protein